MNQISTRTGFEITESLMVVIDENKLATFFQTIQRHLICSWKIRCKSRLKWITTKTVIILKSMQFNWINLTLFTFILEIMFDQRYCNIITFCSSLTLIQTNTMYVSKKFYLNSFKSLCIVRLSIICVLIILIECNLYHLTNRTSAID